MIQIFLSALTATTLMTFFSYLMSRLTNSQFREPQLLNELISRSASIPYNPGKKNFAGWIIHYSIGFLFVILFRIIWKYTALDPGLASGALLGFLFGFIGITGWKVMFHFNSSPPTIKFPWFYIQLLVAHVIFGLGAALIYL